MEYPCYMVKLLQFSNKQNTKVKKYSTPLTNTHNDYVRQG